MMLETVIGKRVVEDLLEWCILQGRSVDISRDPIIVEDRSALDQAISCYQATGGFKLTMSSWYM